MLCEVQSVSSRIWTRVAVSISGDDNHYTTGISNVGLIAMKAFSTLPWSPKPELHHQINFIFISGTYILCGFCSSRKRFLSPTNKMIHHHQVVLSARIYLIFSYPPSISSIAAVILKHVCSLVGIISWLVKLYWNFKMFVGWLDLWHVGLLCYNCLVGCIHILVRMIYNVVWLDLHYLVGFIYEILVS